MPKQTSVLMLLTFVLVIGLVAYAQAQPEAAPQKVSITVKNVVFEPKEVTIAVGTTVEWTDEGGRHSVEADDGSFKSPTLIAGQKFEHKFDTPGSYPYFCGFHGSKGGHLMSGKITVK